MKKNAVPRSKAEFPSLQFQSIDSVLKGIGQSSNKSKLLEYIEVSEEQFKDPEFCLNGEQALKLLRLLKFLPDTTLPVQAIINSISWSNYDVLALAGMSSSTILEATEVALQYSRQYFPYVQIDLHRSDESIIISVEGFIDLEEMTPAAVEIFICGLKKVGEEFAGMTFSNSTIHFSHPCWLEMSDENAEKLYSESLGCTVRFNSSFSGIEAPREQWRKPLLHSNKHSKKVALKILEQNKKNQFTAVSVGERAFEILYRSAERDSYPSLQELAELMHMSPRTLARRLAEEKLQFKSMLTEARLTRAKYLLKHSKFSSKKVALTVGYRDSSSFNRVFKMGTGKTPTQWRIDESHNAQTCTI